MKVFKFGGASVKDAPGVENVALILQSHIQTPVLIVVSAMGKTTNALEAILNKFRSRIDHQPELSALKHFHASIMEKLFPPGHAAFARIASLFEQLESGLNADDNYDQVYDQFVSMGELISTVIVHEYLLVKKLPSRWLDAREYVSTDNTFREGKVNWGKTCQLITRVEPLFEENTFLVTQGFIGRTDDGLTTTLGRDGSDFTAAIFASCLKAESVTIWKDVPGVMNSDPKKIATACVFEELPFREAAESR